MLTFWMAEYSRLCGSMSPAGLISLVSDLSIAFAYFLIPVAMGVLLWRRQGHIPHPGLAILFGLFITACGVTHLVHAIQMPFVTFEHTTLEAAAKAACALLSVGTAGILIWLMPTLLSLQTVSQVRTAMDAAVQRAVAEKNELIWDIHHRCGNQVQVMQSLLRLLGRTSTTPDHQRMLAILAENVQRAASEHAACATKYNLEAPLPNSRVFPSSTRGETVGDFMAATPAQSLGQVQRTTD